MKKRVDVRDLSLGMYVAELDRPWLETPFLFQGFELSSPQEIDQLREHCQYVYIDAELGDDLVPMKGRKGLPQRTQVLRIAEEKLKQEFKVLLESPERNQGKLMNGKRSCRQRSAYQFRACARARMDAAIDITLGDESGR